MQSEYQQMSEHYSSSRTTMRQMSIEKYHPEQEVQPFLTKRDLESIAKLIAENVADKLGHGQKNELNKRRNRTSWTSTGSKASNLYELLAQEKDIPLVKAPDNSQLIRCRTCDEFIKSSRGSCGAFAGKVGGSLSKGLDLKKDFSLYKGHNKTWFRLKKPSPFAFIHKGKQDAHGSISLVATH